MNEEKKDTFTLVLNDLLPDFNEKIDAFIQLYENIRPKLIKRVYRKKRKKYYRLMLRYNPIYDLLPPPSMINFMVRHICHQK